jgi:hypothetical protein
VDPVPDLQLRRKLGNAGNRTQISVSVVKTTRQLTTRPQRRSNFIYVVFPLFLEPVYVCMYAQNNGKATDTAYISLLI